MTDENEYAEVCTHPEPATQAERIAALEAECRQHERAVEYWQAQAKAERKKAQDNLRLAAERATEIGELQRHAVDLGRTLDTAMQDGAILEEALVKIAALGGEAAEIANAALETVRV